MDTTIDMIYTIVGNWWQLFFNFNENVNLAKSSALKRFQLFCFVLTILDRIIIGTTINIYNHSYITQCDKTYSINSFQY